MLFEPSVYKSSAAILLACGIFAPGFASGEECGNLSKSPREVGNAVIFRTAILNVDADGAPNSYRVDGNGLSYTCDGVTAVGSTPKTDPKGWQAKCRAAWKKANITKDFSGLRIFGFAKDASNKPIVQGEGDPLPNEAYISETSVAVPDGPKGTQRHWVDATKIPYVVLPATFLSKYKVNPGDLAVVYWPQNDKFALAVYGDGGSLGEASVRLHQDLGNDPLVNRGGVHRAKRGIDSPVVTAVFPGATTKPTVNSEKWIAEIRETGATVFQHWGGIDRLKTCARR